MPLLLLRKQRPNQLYGEADLKLTVFMPLHNEEQYLKQSIPPVLALNPSQIILGFDRCTDGTVREAERLLQNYHRRLDLYHIRENSGEWCWPLARNMYYAAQLCENSFMFVVSGDTVIENVEPGLRYLDNHLEVGWLSFKWTDYPSTAKAHLINFWGNAAAVFRYVEKRVGSRIALPRLTRRATTGIVYCWRPNSFTEQDWVKARKLIWGIDSYLRFVTVRKGLLAQQHPTGFTYHLRPARRSWKRDFQSGMSRYCFGISFKRTVRSAVLYLRPLLIAGWLRARFLGYARLFS
jgi:glycosyltransferase involved in cell wall biosynthesis